MPAQSGSQIAVIGTEHALGVAITTPGTYVLKVSTRNMANGDVLELRIKDKMDAGSPSEMGYFATYMHAQGETMKWSVPVPVDAEMVCTLKQTSGTARTFPWSIIKL